MWRKKKRFVSAMICTLILLTEIVGCSKSGKKNNIEGDIAMKIYDMKVQNLSEPMGIGSSNPVFSWKLDSEVANIKQGAYMIAVSSTAQKLSEGRYDLWDSGKVESSQNTGIEYKGKALESMQKAYWKVKVWNEDGRVSGWSETASWEMGLLNESDWKASWITRGEESVIDRVLGLEGVAGISSNIITDSIGATDTQYFKMCVYESGPAALGEYNDLGLGGSIYRIQIMEIDFYNGGQKVEPDSSVKITAANNFVWGSQWNTKYINDGDAFTGYTSNTAKQPVYEKPIEIVFDFGKKITFDEVRITCRTDTMSTDGNVCANYPKKYSYMISQDGVNYDMAKGGITVETAPVIPTSGDFADYAPILSKEFKTDANKKVFSARLYISGLGLYEAYINGKVLGGSTYFNPGESDVRDTVYYVTYDITDMLNAENNAVSFMLGNGQYANYRIHKQYGRYYKTDDARSESEAAGMFGEVKGIAQVVISYEDGSIDVVGTDDTWSFIESPITENSWYGGEDYDARLEIKGWNDENPSVERDKWGKARVVTENVPKGSLVAREFLPIVISDADTITSDKISVKELKNENGFKTYLVDMGRNGAGFQELTVDVSQAGKKITMYPAEVDAMNGFGGHINQASCTQSDSNNGNLIYDTYITNDSGKQTFHPKFCYHGYRYVEVTVPEDMTLTSDNFKGYILRTGNDKNGSFECSDEILNRINTLTERSIESNMFSTFTDCPQIEKLGWLETPGLMFYSMSQTYDISSWIPKLIKDMVDAQYKDGRIAAIAPEYFKIGGLYEDVNWNGSIIFTAWSYYEVYKDANIFKPENYNAMKNYVTYLEKKVAVNNVISVGQMGEWGEMTTYGKTPVVLVETTAYYRLAVIMSKISDILGNGEDKAHYEKLADDIKKAFHETPSCYNETHLYGNGTQSGYGCVLYSGIYREEDEARAIEKLIQSIEKADYHLTSGEVGLKQVFGTLAQHGRNDIVYRMITNDTMPGYKYFVDKGLTTLPEYWNFEDLWGSVARSLNHAMMGHVKEWFTRYLAGVNPVSAGYDVIEVKPGIIDEILNVSCNIDTIHGIISTSWNYNKDAGEFEMNLTIPCGVHADIYIPAAAKYSSVKCGGSEAEYELTDDGKYYKLKSMFGSGKYEIRAK